MGHKKTFVWKLTNFSTLYTTHQGEGIDEPLLAEVQVPTLCRPYPSSQIFTTDYGSVTAQWMIRLNSYQNPLVPLSECWNFYLDLVGTEVRSDNNNCEPPAAKRRIRISPNVKITVKCQLFLLQPKKAGGRKISERFRFSSPPKSLQFGPTFTSTQLGWPGYTPDDDVDEHRGHNEAKEILRHMYKWASTEEDTLHVRVRVKLVDIERSVEILKSNLLSNLGQILSSGQASDVVIKCGSESFPVHKFVLSLRSPVFKTMLQTEMKEAASGVITLEDSEPLVLKYFIEFLYTAKVEFDKMSLDQMIGLIAAADKYDVEDLKDFCFQHLLNKLNKGNCGKLAVAAYLHRAEQYQKSRIYEFNAERWKVLGAKAEFQALVKAYPAAFLKP